MPEDEEPIDVVASVGDLDPTVVLLREFLHRSGAVRAVAIIDRGSEEPAMVDCGRLQPIEVTADGRTVVVPHAIELDAQPARIPDVKQLPPFEVKADEGEVASPLGGMEHYALAVLELADILGGRSVALATFTTNDPDAPLSITARLGEPLVVSIGEEEFEMAQGWPS